MRALKTRKHDRGREREKERVRERENDRVAKRPLQTTFSARLSNMYTSAPGRTCVWTGL